MHRHMACNDYIRFCAEVSLLKTEKIHNQSVENAGVAFVNERIEFFEKVNKQ